MRTNNAKRLIGFKYVSWSVLPQSSQNFQSGIKEITKLPICKILAYAAEHYLLCVILGNIMQYAFIVHYMQTLCSILFNSIKGEGQFN